MLRDWWFGPLLQNSSTSVLIAPLECSVDNLESLRLFLNDRIGPTRIEAIGIDNTSRQLESVRQAWELEDHNSAIIRLTAAQRESGADIAIVTWTRASRSTCSYLTNGVEPIIQEGVQLLLRDARRRFPRERALDAVVKVRWLTAAAVSIAVWVLNPHWRSVPLNLAATVALFSGAAWLRHMRVLEFRFRLQNSPRNRVQLEHASRREIYETRVTSRRRLVSNGISAIVGAAATLVGQLLISHFANH